jgi:Ca2+-binding EF-hand superfamily protein
LRETYNNSFNPTQEDIRAWMELTDEDQDGRVSIEEFESAIIKGLQEAGIKLY